MTYNVSVKPSALKVLKKLPKGARKKAHDAISALEFDPRPAGCKKLAGMDDVFRIRVGKYRIIYTINDSVLTVHVVRVRKREDAHRK